MTAPTQCLNRPQDSDQRRRHNLATSTLGDLNLFVVARAQAHLHELTLTEVDVATDVRVVDGVHSVAVVAIVHLERLAGGVLDGELEPHESVDEESGLPSSL